MSKENAIIYFVKYPTPGKVKTRLAKTIGDQEAARLYKKLAEDNFSILRQCRDVDVIVFFESLSDHVKVHQWLLKADGYRPQVGADLGERLTHAFTWAFDSGYQRVVAYGSDTLELTTTIVEQSFSAFKSTDVVIGPAKDGGYYLIGSSSNQPKLFQGINWSTAEVLSQTQEIIHQLKLTYQSLCPLEDLDEVKQLACRQGGTYEFISSQSKERRS